MKLMNVNREEIYRREGHKRNSTSDEKKIKEEFGLKWKIDNVTTNRYSVQKNMCT